VHSLSRRLLVSVSVPLALFFGVMMLVLDTGFRALSERSLQELLDSQMVSLIAAADPLNLAGIILPGDRMPANSGRSFSLRDGVVAETNPSPIENLRTARAG